MSSSRSSQGDVVSVRAVFPPMDTRPEESRTVQDLIDTLHLQPHIEGGYFAETDRDTFRVPNPFSSISSTSLASNNSRSASTSIFYLLTKSTPLGAFHRNRGRTVHTIHKGRGRYVILHADEVAAPSYPGGYSAQGEEKPGAGATAESERARWIANARVEVFTVGQDVAAGERLQWIVDGGKYKASFLLPDKDDRGTDSQEGCLISETVVPGFEYADHDFMTRARFDVLVSEDQKKSLEWMLRKDV